MPTLNRHSRLSKRTTAMKNRLLLAAILLSCQCAVAANGNGCTPSDSIRQKMEIKKMELKKAELVAPAELNVENKKSIQPKAALNKELMLKDDTAEPVLEKPSGSEKRTSVEEMKEAAKRDNKSRNTVKKVNNAKPAFSYPSFPGGNIAVRNFVRKNQRYPEECKSERQRGRVEVTITIAPDGKPHSATITKSSGNEYMDAEAMRVAKLMPKWTPAADSEEPRELKHTIFVNFRPGR